MTITKLDLASATDDMLKRELAWLRTFLSDTPRTDAVRETYDALFDYAFDIRYELRKRGL